VTDETKTNGRRWTDGFWVRAAWGTLMLVWTGTVGVAAHHQGRISSMETEAARNTAAINAKLDSIDNRLMRVENKLDR